MTSTPCPICQQPLHAIERSSQGFGGNYYKCAYCGTYHLDNTTLQLAESSLQHNTHLRNAISYTVRKQQSADRPPLVNLKLIQSLQENDAPPSHRQSCIDLVLWLGKHSAYSKGQYVPVNAHTHGAICAVGPSDYLGLGFVIESLQSQGFLEKNDVRNGYQHGALVRLTYSGWDHFEELLRGHTHTRTAFMAMPFDDALLDHVFKDCFKVATQDAGFELKRLDEEPKAGLIDDRLRVEIRNARFLIAELTGSNRGAYWESGFAEGLGKHVIYTCEKGYFKTNRTHFDTSHMQHVLWDKDDLPVAAAQLTAAIRATLPAEAKMSD